jgi:cell fate (sporulation/competence/biofilm development) regulator YlbF (YheA/YmcA/DUF963 family)
MQTPSENTIIIQKARELCQTILEQPEFQAVRQQVTTFLENPEAQSQYQVLNEKGEFLHHKQHQGVQLTQEEIADFEKHREDFLNNPIARGFLDAQESIHRVQHSVGEYVTKTFELGRVPDASDFKSGSCGEGCGCH